MAWTYVVILALGLVLAVAFKEASVPSEGSLGRPAADWSGSYLTSLWASIAEGTERLLQQANLFPVSTFKTIKYSWMQQYTIQILNSQLLDGARILTAFSPVVKQATAQNVAFPGSHMFRLPPGSSLSGNYNLGPTVQNMVDKVQVYVTSWDPFSWYQMRIITTSTAYNVVDAFRNYNIQNVISDCNIETNAGNLAVSSIQGCSGPAYSVVSSGQFALASYDLNADPTACSDEKCEQDVSAVLFDAINQATINAIYAIVDYACSASAKTRSASVPGYREGSYLDILSPAGTTVIGRKYGSALSTSDGVNAHACQQAKLLTMSVYKNIIPQFHVSRNAAKEGARSLMNAFDSQVIDELHEFGLYSWSQLPEGSELKAALAYKYQNGTVAADTAYSSGAAQQQASFSGRRLASASKTKNNDDRSFAQNQKSKHGQIKSIKKKAFRRLRTGGSGQGMSLDSTVYGISFLVQCQLSVNLVSMLTYQYINTVQGVQFLFNQAFSQLGSQVPASAKKMMSTGYVTSQGRVVLATSAHVKALSQSQSQASGRASDVDVVYTANIRQNPHSVYQTAKNYLCQVLVVSKFCN